MGYKVGTSTEVIDDDAKVTLKTLTVDTSQQYIEIAATFIAPPATGSIDAFAAGGSNPSPPAPTISSIDKFPFSQTSGTATDVGDLSLNSSQTTAGISSKTDGFAAGSFGPPVTNRIDKYPFSISGGTATNIGDLAVIAFSLAGNVSYTDGFASGGGSPTVSPPEINNIQKFPFAQTSGTATDVADLITSRFNVVGQSSPTEAFTSGGSTPAVWYNVIEKFPFSISSGTATDVGDLSKSRRHVAAHSSLTEGFTAGGQTGPSPFVGQSTEIDKFPFSISSGTATDIGDLTQGRWQVTGNCTQSEGFNNGGEAPGLVTTIDKFPFSQTSGTATDIGDLSRASRASSTSQS